MLYCDDALLFCNVFSYIHNILGSHISIILSQIWSMIFKQMPANFQHRLSKAFYIIIKLGCQWKVTDKIIKHACISLLFHTNTL